MSNLHIPLTFHSDSKGYFDKECPNENCLFAFKVNMEDWKEKVSDEAVYCPMCGHIATSDKWFSQKHIEVIRNNAMALAQSYIQGELNKTFQALERTTKHNKYISISYKPGKRITFTNNPIGQSEEWEQEIQCSNCTVRYSVIGHVFFCPCCGNDVIESTLDNSLNINVEMLNSLPDMQKMLEATSGIDIATSICRTILENSLGSIISIFQKFAEIRFKALSTKTVRSNDFQILEKGSNLFANITGQGYDAWLDDGDLSFLNIMFQRRHILEHNAGIVDAKYLEKSKDIQYNIRQRIVVDKAEIFKLIEVIRQLCNALKQIKSL